MRTLIIYATQYGSAEICANQLASQIGGDVFTHNLDQTPHPDPAAFNQVILGGSIYIGRIQPAIIQYIAAHQTALLQKKLGLYICCLYSGEKAEAEMKAAFPPEILAHASARGIFGGALFYKKMKWLEKKMVSFAMKREMGAAQFRPGQDLDNIDQAAIERFATYFR